MQNQEYTPEERLYFTEFLYKDVIGYMNQLLSAMEGLKIEFSDSSLHAQSVIMKEAKYVTSSFVFPENVCVSIKLLWADAGVKACYERRSEFYLPDPAG